MLAVLLLSLCSYSYCDEVKLTSPNQTTVSDDGYAEVPLQFVFPFYGEEFETSYMFTNGVVGFRNPTDSQVESHWCCQGLDLVKMSEDGTDISRYGYAIAPLWTDLIDLEQGNSGLFTEGDTSQQTYRWKNLAEFYDATKLNSFELQIKQDGSYTVDYTAVNIQNHAITIGETGDLSTQGSYEGTQNYYYPTGYQGVPDSYGNEQNSINVFNTLCAANPLYDPQCSGYAEAYAQQLYTQECNKDATYDKDCDGYEKAYFEQQCMYDPQYDKTCNGYIEIKKEEEKFEPKELSIKGEDPIQEILELPDLITDFAGTTGYQIEGMPSASAPVVEPRREEVGMLPQTSALVSSPVPLTPVKVTLASESIDTTPNPVVPKTPVTDTLASASTVTLLRSALADTPVAATLTAKLVLPKSAIGACANAVLPNITQFQRLLHHQQLLDFHSRLFLLY